MKTKSDFITNSSAASFVVMGLRIEYYDIPKDFIKLIAEKVNMDPDDIEDDLIEVISSLISGTDLDCSGGKDFWEYRTVMVGIPYTSMHEDETLKEFKERSKNLIKEKIGIDKKVYHIEEGWESR